MKLIMKHIFSSGMTLAIVLLTVSSCKDIFHSKENINYVNLVMDKMHQDSVKSNKRNYYKFHAEEGKTYYISWHYATNWVQSLEVTAFWYDTGLVAMGEKKLKYSGYRGVVVNDEGDTSSFLTASRSGDVVIRVLKGDIVQGEGKETTYNFLVSTRKYDWRDKKFVE